MSKKGVELGMNTIVISIIAVIVLVVSVFLLTDKFAFFRGTISSCENLKGKCVSDCNAIGKGSKITAECPKTGASTCCQNTCTILGGDPTKSACPKGEIPFISLEDQAYKCCKK